LVESILLEGLDIVYHSLPLNGKSVFRRGQLSQLQVHRSVVLPLAHVEFQCALDSMGRQLFLADFGESLNLDVF